MIDNDAVLLACRAQAKTLVAATTGLTTLAASAAGGQDGASAYTRTAGSFITDGFAVGMELASAGFGANVVTVVTQVTDLLCTVSALLANDAAAAGRSLSVGFPSSKLWDNLSGQQPTPGVPYVVEQYIDGPVAQMTIGPLADVEALPMYCLMINVAGGTGNRAISKYADALLKVFAPGTALALANGDIVRVRRDIAPFRKQTYPGATGFVVKAVTIPLRIRTKNII